MYYIVHVIILVVTLNFKTENMYETCLYPGLLVQIICLLVLFRFACLFCLFNCFALLSPAFSKKSGGT